jgi:phytoene dehydrogenase-like protein
LSGKTVIVIGAGMAGLSAGCYLQMNGYDTEILEAHTISGGLCTSWKRGEYTFDGCIHWLGGSGPASAFYEMWSELVDLPSIQFIDHDLRFDIELGHLRDRHGDFVFHLYGNVERLKRYLLDIAPEDAWMIEAFMASVRRLQQVSLPPLWDVAPKVRKLRHNLRLIRYLPFLPYLRKWSQVTNYDLAERFQNPFVGEGFRMLYMGKEFSILGITMQLALFDQRSAGFPVGGSRAFAEKIADRYLSLGGQIHYRSRVARILVEADRGRDRVVGVQLESGETHDAALVVSAADGYWTIYEALQGQYVDDSIRELYAGERLERFESMILVSLGVDRTFESAPHILRFPLNEPLTLADGSRFERMEAHIYNYDPTLAPPGKTVVTVTLYTANDVYWSELRARDRDAYRAAKDDLARQVIERLDRKFGDVRAHVEETDVATPATLIRYTSNWHGSYQGWYPPTDILSAARLPKELPGLESFYMAGQWVEPGGGLPQVALSGRNVAQIICQRDGKSFRTTRAWQEDADAEF